MYPLTPPTGSTWETRPSSPPFACLTTRKAGWPTLPATKIARSFPRVPCFCFDHQPIRAIVCDIEGTTTDIAFVKEVLFPYAEQRLESFMADIADTAEGQAIRKRGKDRSRRFLT